MCIILLAKGAKQPGVSSAFAMPTPAQSEALGELSGRIASPKASVGASDIGPALVSRPASSEGLRPATVAEQISSPKEPLAAANPETDKVIRKSPGHLATGERESKLAGAKANFYRRVGSVQSRSSKNFKTLLITMWRHLSGKSKAAPNKRR